IPGKVSFPNCSNARVDGEKLIIRVDEPVADAHSRGEKIVNVLERIFQEQPLGKYKRSSRQVDLIAAGKDRLIDDERSILVATEIESVEAEYTARFRIAYQPQREVDVFRIAVAVGHREPGADFRRPGLRRLCRRLSLAMTIERAEKQHEKGCYNKK